MLTKSDLVQIDFFNFLPPNFSSSTTVRFEARTRRNRGNFLAGDASSEKSSEPLMRRDVSRICADLEEKFNFPLSE